MRSASHSSAMVAGRGFGDHAAGGLGAGERGLEVKHPLNMGAVGEHLGHVGPGEDVIEKTVPGHVALPPRSDTVGLINFHSSFPRKRVIRNGPPLSRG